MERFQALVLGSTRFSESSKIVTLFTRESGRMAVMAKGALRKGSRFGPALEMFALSRCQVAVSPRREVQTLVSSDLEDYFPRTREKPGPLCAAGTAVELVRQAVQPQAPQPGVFDLLANFLRRLEREAEAAPDIHEKLVWAFVLHLLKALGWGLRLSSCVRCGKKAAGGKAAVSPILGGILCADCRASARDGRELSAEEMALLRGLSSGPFDRAPGLAPRLAPRINELLRAFLNTRFEKNVSLNSLDLFYRLHAAAV